MQEESNELFAWAESEEIANQPLGKGDSRREHAGDSANLAVATIEAAMPEPAKQSDESKASSTHRSGIASDEPVSQRRQQPPARAAVPSESDALQQPTVEGLRAELSTVEPSAPKKSRAASFESKNIWTDAEIETTRHSGPHCSVPGMPCCLCPYLFPAVPVPTCPSAHCFSCRPPTARHTVTPTARTPPPPPPLPLLGIRDGDAGTVGRQDCWRGV